MTLEALESLAASCTELHLVELIRPGVYVLLSGQGVEYIGESNNVLARVGMHSRAFEFDRILYFAESNKRERRAIEGALARRFNPARCRVFSKRDRNRDKSILERFGLQPDAENARIVTERASACWSAEARANAARAHRENAARRKKEQKRFARLGVTWSKNWLTRRRRLTARHFWNAVRPLLDEAKAS